jgi:class 3 adenylate cyclase
MSFTQRLDDYHKETDRAQRKLIGRAIWKEFGADKAVFVMDMSGFSLVVRERGIVHYLSMIRRMQKVCRPIIRRHEGKVVKFEADNCFAVFPTVVQAIDAGIEINRAFEVVNEAEPSYRDIEVAIGLDYGPILLLDGKDFFGDPVNLASKLGEDLARPAEILTSNRAYQTIRAKKKYPGAEVHFSVSGIEIHAWRITY